MRKLKKLKKHGTFLEPLRLYNVTQQGMGAEAPEAEVPQRPT